MSDLGRLDDLPIDYRNALSAQNLVPLWPSLRAVLPPPLKQARARHWSYAAIKPLLLCARRGGHLLCSGRHPTPVQLRKLSSSEPAFLFMADETPPHKKFGIFKERN